MLSTIDSRNIKDSATDNISSHLHVLQLLHNLLTFNPAQLGSYIMMMNQWSSFSHSRTHSQPMNLLYAGCPNSKSLPTACFLLTPHKDAWFEEGSVDAICHCFLTHGSCHWTQISSATAMGATSSACQKRWLECFHLSNVISK